MEKTYMTLQLTRIATVLALSCVATNVLADGYVGSKPNNAPELWSGPYFGMYFGGGAGHMDTSFSSTTDSTSLTFDNLGAFTESSTTRISTIGQLDNRHLTGSVADLFVGYNYHKNNAKLLVGAQLEGSVFSDITMKSANVLGSVSNVSDTKAAGTTTTISHSSVGTSTRYDLSSMLSIIGRAGFLARPNTLIYGLAGPTEGNFVIPDAAEGVRANKSQWQLGYSAGGGLEHKFNENWSVVAEYRHMHFHINTQLVTSMPSTTPTSATTNVVSTYWSSNIGMNVGKIGIVFRC